MKSVIKKILYISSLAIFLVLPFSVFAYNEILSNLNKVGYQGGYESVDEFTMSKMIGTIIASFLSLLGIIFVVLMIYGGFKWMKASGREDEVGKAQDIIRQAIIGLIITASSYAIYSFVMSGLLG